MKDVKRSEIYFANLDPVIGREQGGTRPVLIIQNDVGNEHSDTIIVAAITSSQTKAEFPTHVWLINPIIVWGGVIVDGHNRYRIVSKHPEIQFSTCEKIFADRYEAIAWICKNQLGRRNLTKEQKKYLIGKQYEAEKATNGAVDGFRGNQYSKVVGLSH